MNGFVEVVVAVTVVGWRVFGSNLGCRDATRARSFSSGTLRPGRPGRSLAVGGGRRDSAPLGVSIPGGRWGGLGGARRARPFEPARWANRRDVRALVVGAPTAGRLTLGTAPRRLLAAERGHSVLVVGPTQSRKTSGFAIPAILEWEGPVVAASVKSDLARHTLTGVRARDRCGCTTPRRRRASLRRRGRPCRRR